MICAIMWGAHAAETYRINTSVTSGGIDLVGGGYAGDRLEGPLTTDIVSVEGVVTHSPDLSAQNPFRIFNSTADAKLVFKDSGLLGTVPLLVTGKESATTYFEGDTLVVDETTDPSILVWTNATVQLDHLTVSSKTRPATWKLPFKCNTFRVRKNMRVGYDGGTGTLVVAETGLGRTNGSMVPGLGVRDESKLYLGDASAPGLGVSSGLVRIDNGTAYAWNVYFGSDNVPPCAEGKKDAPNELMFNGGDFMALYYHLRGSRDARIVFNGGRMKSWGWGTFLTFEPNASGDWIFEGVNGKSIDVYFNKYASFVEWKSGATGRLIFRGDSNVYLYGGDYNSSSSWAAQCKQGSAFSNRADGNGIVWDHTGDLYFKPESAGAVCRSLIKTDNFLPHGAHNGGVIIETNTKLFTVDLWGTTQSCNSLTGGGTITNTAETAATINIGENGNACAFDVVICGGSPIDVHKTGIGEMTVKRPVPGLLAVDAGSVVVTDASGGISVGTLSVADGATFKVRGGTFAAPGDFDLSSSGTGKFLVTEGGVLRVGGEGDVVFDVSRLEGDASAVLEKTGTGRLTLVGESEFTGAFRVTEGTIAVASGASLRTLASVEAAAGAVFEIADGLALAAYALRMRDADGMVETTYSGVAADGIATLPGLAGAGTIRVMRSTALWTGLVNDSAAETGNWQNMTVVPDVTGGTFTPILAAAADDNGKIDVTPGMAFKGIELTTDVTAFSFDASSADASLRIGTGGLTFAGTADDATVRTLTFDTPVAISAGTQAWTLPSAQQTVVVNGPLSGTADGESSLVMAGGGTVRLNGTGSTYAGSVVISNETVYAGGYEPFGSSNATGTAKLVVRQKNSEARLMLSNAVISKPVELDYSRGDDATWGGRRTIGCAENTTNVFLGPVTPSLSGGVDAFELPSSSTVVFAGGYGTPSKKFYVNWKGTGMVVVSNKPFYATTWESGAKQQLTLNCTGNTYTAMAAWTPASAYNAYAPVPLNVDFRCDWGFDLPGTKTAFSGTWDLHGHDQRMGLVFASENAVIRSFDGPATFYVHQDCSKWNSNYPYVNGNTPGVPHPVPPSQCRIEGDVNLHKTGKIEFALSNRVIGATGTVTVAEGAFTLCADAAWPAATNVVVTGTGVFNLSANGQLGRGTDFALDGDGVLNIPDGVVQRARFLWLDGAGRAAAPGVYGAADNSSVPAKFRTPHITGGGLLNVIGDGTGFLLIFR